VTLAIELRKQGKEWKDIYPLCIPASVLYSQVAYCLPDDTAFHTGIEVYRVLLGERICRTFSAPSCDKKCLP
jgi:hypothetical protein